MYQNKFSEIHPDLRQLIREQKLLANIRSESLLKSTTAKFLHSLDPNFNLSRLNIPFDNKIKSNLRDIESIINEQWSYLNYELDGMKIFIVVYLNDMPLGGIVIFYNPNYLDIHESHYIYIQGITKYPVIYLIDTLYPEYTQDIPKLNSLLDPIIKQIGQELGVQYIYVNPVGRQGEFLEKYYNYKLNINQPPIKSCLSILDSLIESNNYFKQI